MKVAKVRLGWKPSVSSGVVSQTISVQIDGVETLNSQLEPGVSEVIVDVAASKSVVFSVTTEDDEGNTAVSELYTFTIGDLEAPQPATDLFHEIVGVVEVTDPVAS